MITSKVTSKLSLKKDLSSHVSNCVITFYNCHNILLFYNTNIIENRNEQVSCFSTHQTRRKSSQDGAQRKHKSTQVKTCDDLRSRLIRPLGCLRLTFCASFHNDQLCLF